MYMYHKLHSGPKQLINNRKQAIVITSPSTFLFKVTLFNTQPGFSVRGQNSDQYLLKCSTVSALSYFINNLSLLSNSKLYKHFLRTYQNEKLCLPYSTVGTIFKYKWNHTDKIYFVVLPSFKEFIQ